MLKTQIATSSPREGEPVGTLRHRLKGFRDSVSVRIVTNRWHRCLQIKVITYYFYFVQEVVRVNVMKLVGGISCRKGWTLRSIQKLAAGDIVYLFTAVTFFFFTTVLSHWNSSHGKFGLLFPGESQLRQSRATQPSVHTGCFSVFIIHRILTWTTGSLTCAQGIMHAIAHGEARTHVRVCTENWLLEKKITWRTGKSNLRQRRDGPTL